MGALDQHRGRRARPSVAGAKDGQSDAGASLARPAPAESLLLIDRYLNVRGTRLGRRSVEAYRADLCAFATTLGARSLLTALADDVAAWFRTNTRDAQDPTDARPWSPRTAHRRRSALYRFYEWARRQELIARNPVDEIELPRYQKAQPVVIGDEHIDRLFVYVEAKSRTADDRVAALYVLDAAILRLMERLALRVSEASGIRLSHMKRVGGEVHAWVQKKGNKPKTYPLTGVVLDAYERWLRVRRTVTPRPGHEDFLFIHPWTGHRVSRQRAWTRLRRLVTEAGVPAETVAVFSPHKFRHARARAMLDAGWTLAAVQAVLDHANIATTSVYLEDDERARLDALRAQSQPSRASKPGNSHKPA